MFQPEIYIKNFIKKSIKYIFDNKEDVVALFLILYIIFFLYSFFTFMFFNFLKKKINKSKNKKFFYKIEKHYKEDRRKFFFFIVRPCFYFTVYTIWTEGYIFLYKEYIILCLTILQGIIYNIFLSRYNKRCVKKLKDFIGVSMGKSYAASTLYDDYLERSLLLRRNIILYNTCYYY